jgi:hypothetical protein
VPKPVVMEGKLDAHATLGNVGEKTWHLLQLRLDPIREQTDRAFERLNAMMDKGGMVRVTVELLETATSAQAEEIVEGLPDDLRQLVLSRTEDDDADRGIDG